MPSQRSRTPGTRPNRLPPAAERALVAAAESGDAAARTKLVETFWPSIAGVARVYQASSAVNRDELMQEGVVGLLRAAGRFDPEMGTPFWAYASWWVRQAMQQLVAEVTRPVVLSDRAFRRLARIKDARSQFVRERGEEPTTSDLVEATELTRVQIENLMVAERPPRGFEEPLGGEEGATTTLGETVADPTAEDAYERVIEGMEIEELRDLTKGLADRERAIVFAHYGLGRPAETLREIAEGLDLSVERVRQIEERALEKLREAVIEGEAPAPLRPPAPVRLIGANSGIWGNLPTSGLNARAVGLPPIGQGTAMRPPRENGVAFGVSRAGVRGEAPKARCVPLRGAGRVRGADRPFPQGGA